MGTADAAPVLTFTPLGGGVAHPFVLPPIQSGHSGVFDMRYSNGDTLQPFCSGVVNSACLADGEYSLTITAPGAMLAGVVNVISPTTAMGYAATPLASSRVFLPNTTRTLGGATGWSTPVIIQSATATQLRLSWYRFTDGTLVTQQTLLFAQAGAALRVDPRDVPALPDDTQFAVVADGVDGTIVGIVSEFAANGDNAMIYEGFSGP